MTFYKPLMIGLVCFISIASSKLESRPMTANIDFTDTQEIQNWIIVNDTVMGGRSQASLAVQEQMMVFSGNLSLQNNGGFASTRRVYSDINWTSDNTIRIQLVGDGRDYQFRLRTNRGFDGMAYVAGFQTDKDKLTSIEFTLDDFIPQFRGRIVTNAPKLKFEDVRQIGFMLADNTPGMFALKILNIEAMLKA